MGFLDELKKQTTISTTEKGAKSFSSTLDKNLDLYSQAGAIRSRMDSAGEMFVNAYSEDKELALRNMAYLRDIREGLGEREAFRRMFYELIDSDNEVASKFLDYIPFLGRWDDLAFVYAHAKKNESRNRVVIERVIEIIEEQLEKDLLGFSNGEEISLMAKWLPSPSVKNKERKQQANMLAYDLNMKVSTFRKTLSKLRKHIGIVETKLTDRDYSEINFETLPSRALYKYRQAFERHMENEYDNFLNRVESGEVKMNASNVLPYEIVRDYSGTDNDNWFWEPSEIQELNQSLEATWKSLDDAIGNAEESVIVVADTSGSMTGSPWNVAQSLAIYSAERLKGAFEGHFITFSSEPKLIELPKNGTLMQKINEYNKHSIIDNTNIQAVFDLILETAVSSGTSQEDMPTKIIIVSDMQFDSMTSNSDLTNFENAKRKFKEAGYDMPNMVFWNVDSRSDDTPVRHNEQGVALVSGLTPNIFKQVLLKEFSTPRDMMIETLMSERYDFVKETLK